MKKVIFALVLGFALGCSTTTKYEEVLNSWVGTDADQLAWTWGPPSGVYPLSDGKRMLSYFNSSGTSTFSAVSPNLGMVTTYSSAEYCRTHFLIEKSNVISGWHWQGTDCKVNTVVQKISPINGWSRKDVKESHPVQDTPPSK